MWPRMLESVGQQTTTPPLDHLYRNYITHYVMYNSAQCALNTFHIVIL